MDVDLSFTVWCSIFSGVRVTTMSSVVYEGYTHGSPASCPPLYGALIVGHGRWGDAGGRGGVDGGRLAGR